MGLSRRELALALAICSGVASAQIVEPTPAPDSGNTATPTNIRYFSQAGSDSNDCLSDATACLSQTKAQSFLPAGNVTISLKCGNYFFWDKFGQHNLVNATNSTTYATNPVLGQNVTINSYGGCNAIMEGGDEIQSLTWTSVDGAGTFSGNYAAGTVIAENLYVDTKNADSGSVGKLLPAPNGPIAAWSGNVPAGTLVSMSGSGAYVAGNITATSTGTPNVNQEAWRPFIDSRFSTANTGLQNVQLVPGSFYNDIANHTIYVHLLDGSNPGSHVLQASNRSSAILCESCNGWYVTGLTVEKYIYDGIAFMNYSMANSTNQYYTNVNNQVVGNNFWDDSSELNFLYTGQSGATRLWRSFDVGFSINNLSSATTDEASTGWKVNNNFFGRSGFLPGEASGNGYETAVLMRGGTRPEMGNNTATTWVANAFTTDSGVNPWVHDNKALVQNRGSVLFISNNKGLLVERNTISGGAGDAVQSGGYTTGCTGTWDYTGHPENDFPGAYPCVVRWNTVTDFGQLRGALYNCFDGNTDQVVKNMLFDGNTAVNCWGAAYTFEVNNGAQAGAGLTDVTFRNNIASMHKNYWQYTDGTYTGINGSNLLYFANATVPGLNGFFHSYNNVWQLGSSSTPFVKIGSYAQYAALVGDNTSIIVPNTSDPIFTDITNGVYTLKQNSPAINRPVAGKNAGALGIDYTPVYGSRFGGAGRLNGSGIRQ